MNSNFIALFTFIFIATVILVPKLAAQEEIDTLEVRTKPSRSSLTVQVGGFVPVGEFSDTTDPTIGISAGVRYFLTDFMALYAGFGGTGYSSEQTKFLGFKLDTRTGMFYFEAGPQIRFGDGPVTPYIYGSVGIAYFSTTTTIYLGDEALDSETHASDTNPEFSVGVGCLIRIKQHHLDIGVTYQQNGTMTRLIDDKELTSETNTLRIMAGMAF